MSESTYTKSDIMAALNAVITPGENESETMRESDVVRAAEAGAAALAETLFGAENPREIMTAKVAAICIKRLVMSEGLDDFIAHITGVRDFGTTLPEE